MPSACSVLSALFWLISIAALPLAKSPGASGPFLYCTLLGLTTLLAIRSTYCLTPLTMPSLVKVGLPLASNGLPPFCLPKM